MTTPSASPAKIIKIAKAEVGYREGYSNGHWNNHQKYSPAVPSLEWSQNQAWCATFVSWCAMKAGLKSLYPVTASTDLGASWFKQRKQWSEYPAIGAQIFFGANGDMNHTGIVYDYDDTYVYTIEGNTNTSGSREGNGVYLMKHARRQSRIQGYGYPAFVEGIASADPAWKSKAPKPTAPAKPAEPAKPAAKQIYWKGERLELVKWVIQGYAKNGNPAQVKALEDILKIVESTPWVKQPKGKGTILKAAAAAAKKAVGLK